MKNLPLSTDQKSSETIPFEVVIHYELVPLGVVGKTVIIGIPPSFPENQKEALRFILSNPIEFKVFTSKQIACARLHYFGIGLTFSSCPKCHCQTVQDICYTPPFDGDEPAGIVFVYNANGKQTIDSPRWNCKTCGYKWGIDRR